MTQSHSIVRSAGVVLGSVGFAACIASMIVVWIGSNRLGRGADGLFNSAERSLNGVRQRAMQVQERIASATITAADIEKSLLDWTKKEASERIALKLKATEKSEQLTLALKQAGDWLVVAESSVGIVRDLLSSGSSMNDRVDTNSVDRLLEELAFLRDKLNDAKDVLADLQQRLAALSEGESREQRIQEVAQFALRLAATLGSLDSRLTKFEDRLSAAESQLQTYSATSRWWLRLATSGVTLLLIWMALGQVALSRLAWLSWGDRNR